MSAELQCRRATLVDREAILNIISPFGGLDYLPAQYNHMIENPNFVGVLGELDGEVVAFVGAYVINDDTTMMTKGSRVKEELQGRGIYTRLWRYLRDTVRDRAPGLKYEEFATHSTNPLLDKPVSKRLYTELYRRPIRCYSIQREINTELGSPSSGRVQEMEVEDLRKILTDNELSTIFFPRRLVTNFRVYRPIVENVNILKTVETYVTKTISCDHKLIMFGAWYQCVDYLGYSIDVYGKPDDSLFLSQHFDMHAKKALELHDGEVRFLIFTEPEFVDAIDSACGLLHFRPGHFISTHCVWLSREV